MRLWLMTMFHSHSMQAGYGSCDLLQAIHASITSNCSLPGLTHRSVSSMVNGWLQSLVDLTHELITVCVSIFIRPALPWCLIMVYQTSRTVSVWAFPVSFPNCSYQSWSRHQVFGCSLLLLSTRFLGQDQHLQLSWTLHRPAPDPLLRPIDGRYGQKGWYPRCDPMTHLVVSAAERILDRKSASRCVMMTLHLGRDDWGKENAVSPP